MGFSIRTCGALGRQGAIGVISPGRELPRRPPCLATGSLQADGAEKGWSPELTPPETMPSEVRTVAQSESEYERRHTEVDP